MTFFKYKPKNSPVHKLPVFLKFLLLFSQSFLAYQANWLVNTILLAIFIILSHLSLQTIYQNLKFLLFYTIFFFLVKSLGNQIELLRQNFIFVINFMQKLAFILFASSIFYETTSRFEIFSFFESLQRVIFRKKDSNFALILTLIIICISEIFEIYKQLNLAYEARNSKAFFLKNAYLKATILFPALVEELIVFANNAYKSIENRS